MTIKHMPSGLFPHFDSALERRPFYVRGGDTVQFGCRLDGSKAESVKMIITDDAGTREIDGVFHSVNDRGQRYFQFTHNTKEKDNSFTYRFVTSDDEASKVFECPVLQELTLLPEVVRNGDVTNMIYRTDTQEYRIEISSVPCIRIILAHYSTGSVNKNEVETEQSCVEIREGGKTALRICPTLKVMVDQQGAVYNAQMRLKFPGTAVYGLGEKFDAVNQVGKKPLNYVVEQFANQGDKTYIPIPFMFTDAGVSFLQKSSYPSSFDFTSQDQDEWIDLDIFAACPKTGVLFEATAHTGTPAQLLSKYTDETGTAVLPPKWAFGPWMSSNGWNTQKEALEQIQKMNETAIPSTVMVCG